MDPKEPKNSADLHDNKTEQVTENITRQGDKYRWIYNVNLWTDTFVPVMVLKIFLLASLVPALIVFLANAFEGYPAEGLRAFITVYGISVGIVIALLIIAYPIFVLAKGGRYSILFEMDDQGINHIEIPPTVKHSDLMRWAGFATGLIAGNPTLMGANLLAMSKSQMYSTYSYISKVINYNRKGVMKIICTDMTRNLIYTQPADFDFVRQFIIGNCSKDVKILNK